MNAPTKPRFVDPLPDVPAFLKSIPNWIRWKLETANGKPTKVPYRVGGGKAASTRPEDWTDYQTAVTGTTIDSNGGVGFVVNGGIVGFDLDGCHDPKTGNVTQWAEQIIDALDAYTEVTPSQSGVRVWVRGTLPGTDRVFNLDPAVGYGDKVKIEVFTERRYFTVTGEAYFQEAGDVEVRDLTSVYHLLHEIRGKHPAPTTVKDSVAEGGELTKIELLGTFHTSKYDIFTHGEIESCEPFVISNRIGRLTYPSQSEADLGFCTVLAVKHDGDVEKIKEAFINSPLYREKWGRADYQKNTIERAVKSAEKIKAKTGDQMALPSQTASTTVVSPVSLSDGIPDFDSSVITGIYKEIVDAACDGTTIPRQYAFLAAKTYVGSLIAGKITFENTDTDSSYYGTVIGETGTGKGLAWKRVVEQICTIGHTIIPAVKIIDGADSGAGLKDAFFDPPKEAPIICYVDEITSLGHKAGEKKNPEIIDTIIELANKHTISRTLAARGKRKATRSHDNARLSLYVCGQNGEVITAAFAGRTKLGIYERLYPEYSPRVLAGKLPKIDPTLALNLWNKINQLPKSGEIKMGPGVEDQLEAFWTSLPNEMQTRVRLKSYLAQDMFMSAYGRGSMVAEAEDLELAIKIFRRQIVIREKHFSIEVPDKVGLYLSRLKAITEEMRRRLNAGEPIGQVAMSLRDFQTATNAFRDNELHTFQIAWRNWDAQMATTEVTGKNGHKYKKFVPEPNEDEMWASS